MSGEARTKASARDRAKRYRARKRGEDVPIRRPGPASWPPSGVAYDSTCGTLTVDGVTFSLSMLRDFIATLTPGVRFGPVFLERTGETICFHHLDCIDVRIIHRCQDQAEH